MTKTATALKATDEKTFETLAALAALPDLGKEKPGSKGATNKPGKVSDQAYTNTKKSCSQDTTNEQALAQLLALECQLEAMALHFEAASREHIVTCQPSTMEQMAKAANAVLRDLADHIRDLMFQEEEDREGQQ